MNSDMKTIKDKTSAGEKASMKSVTISVLKQNKDPVLHEFYMAYSHYISNRYPDGKKRQISYLSSARIPVKNNFSAILDRFISFLKDGFYNLSIGEQHDVQGGKDGIQFEGNYPWGTDEAIVNCPDSYNLLTVKL